MLDAPGVLPPRIADQSAAARLAICNDIGEAAYAVAGVASVLIELIQRLPSAGERYWRVDESLVSCLFSLCLIHCIMLPLPFPL